jgi:threonyl-tRNA synthetase
MNCPGHLLIYGPPRSHSEFPLRPRRWGSCTGASSPASATGSSACRPYPDDAHHFCTPEQIEGEIALLIVLPGDLLGLVSATCASGSTRPAKSIGSDEIWGEPKCVAPRRARRASPPS